MDIKSAFPIVAQALGGKLGVKVVIGAGMDACTDGQTVWLPALASDNHLKEVAWGFLIHEASHVRFTDFFPQHPGEDLRNAIWNVLEDARVEAAICREYPGARGMLQAPLEHLCATGRIKTPNGDDHPAQILLGYILMYLRGRVLGQPAAANLVTQTTEVMEATFPQGIVTKLAAQLPRVVNLRSTQEALKMADDILRFLQQEARNEPEPPPPGDEAGSGQGQDQDPGDEAGSDQDPDQNPDDEAGPDQGQDQDPDDEAGSDQGQDQDPDDEAGPDQGQDQNPGGATEQDAKVEALRAVLAAGHDDLPEDAYDQVKSDLIEEAIERPGIAPLPIKRIEKPNCPSADKSGAIGESAKIRAALQGLVQSHRRDRAMWKRHGTRVSHRRLARVAVGDSRIFRKEVKREAPNTAIDVLVDLSGSMNGWAPEVGKRMADVALEAALALALGLEGVPGVSQAVSAFGSFGFGDDVLGVIVRHDERVRNRLDSFRLNADGSTPLAEALMALLPSLLARREERKQVIVITDGDPNSTLSALEVIQAAEQTGVEMVGIGIGTDAVKSLFRRWTVIGSVADLKKSLFKVAEGLLLAA